MGYHAIFVPRDQLLESVSVLSTLTYIDLPALKKLSCFPWILIFAIILQYHKNLHKPLDVNSFFGVKGICFIVNISRNYPEY